MDSSQDRYEEHCDGCSHEYEAPDSKPRLAYQENYAAGILTQTKDDERHSGNPELLSWPRPLDTKITLWPARLPNFAAVLRKYRRDDNGYVDFVTELDSIVPDADFLFQHQLDLQNCQYISYPGYSAIGDLGFFQEGLERLGHGSNGDVYKIILNKTEYALKITKAGRYEHFKREVMAYQHLMRRRSQQETSSSGPPTLTMHGFGELSLDVRKALGLCDSPGKYAILLDCIDGCTLLELRQQLCPESLIARFNDGLNLMSEIDHSLHRLCETWSSVGLSHESFKLANILVSIENHEPRLYLIDFGRSQLASSSDDHHELLRRWRYVTAFDHERIQLMFKQLGYCKPLGCRSAQDLTEDLTAEVPAIQYQVPHLQESGLIPPLIPSPPSSVFRFHDAEDKNTTFDEKNENSHGGHFLAPQSRNKEECWADRLRFGYLASVSDGWGNMLTDRSPGYKKPVAQKSIYDVNRILQWREDMQAVQRQQHVVSGGKKRKRSYSDGDLRRSKRR